MKRQRNNVLLQKLDDDEAKPIVGFVDSLPKAGTPIVIELADGIHQYVTTPVIRFLRSNEKSKTSPKSVKIYVETMNSKYRMILDDENLS